MKTIMSIAVPAIAAISFVAGSQSRSPQEHVTFERARVRFSDAQARQLEHQGPARITESEAKHLVAYFSKGQNKIFVYNRESFAAGVTKGVFHVTWRPGASRATISVPTNRVGAGGKPITMVVRYTAAVVYGESPGKLVGTNPNLGDTKLVENQELKNVTEKKGPCNAGAGAKNSKAWREVARAYSYLDDDGDVSGQETYMEYGESYFYAVKDCSKGYLGSGDANSTWMLSWQPWPLP